MSRKGHIWIISAPSGAGKTSLVARLVEMLPQLVVSVSHTTRAPRPGEVHGVHYYFVTPEAFRELDAQGVFLESAEVFGHHYGTSQSAVDAACAQGLDVILEIDWQGAQLVQARIPDARSIFIFPPSLAALQTRLEKRRKDSPEVIAQRLSQAQAEIAHFDLFDYLVVNADFEQAAHELSHIILAARLERHAQLQAQQDLIQDLLG